MARFQCDANLTIRLEAADPRTMAGARINHHKRTKIRINHNGFWRDNAHQTIIDRPVKLSPVEHKFGRKLEHVRYRVGLLAKAVTTLAHGIPKEHTALGRIDGVLHGRPSPTGSASNARVGFLRDQ